MQTSSKSLAALWRAASSISGPRLTSLFSHTHSTNDPLAVVPQFAFSRSYARSRMARRIPIQKSSAADESEDESECDVPAEEVKKDDDGEDSDLNDIYIYHKDMDPFGDDDESDEAENDENDAKN